MVCATRASTKKNRKPPHFSDPAPTLGGSTLTPRVNSLVNSPTADGGGGAGAGRGSRDVPNREGLRWVSSAVPLISSFFPTAAVPQASWRASSTQPSSTGHPPGLTSILKAWQLSPVASPAWRCSQSLRPLDRPRAPNSGRGRGGVGGAP